MKVWHFCQLYLFLMMFGLITTLQAEEASTSRFSPTEASQASWVFSGVATNESGENYGYFFQIQRDGQKFHAIAALLDGQTQAVIELDENEAVIEQPSPYNLHVGRAFLRFNPINGSWVFGLRPQDNKGFNFKVDMLEPPDNQPSVQDLRQGVELFVNQTNHLNGHIQTGNGKEEQFVTARNAWFRQMWLSSAQQKHHDYTGVLCRFNDGSGFYAVNLVEPDALRGAVAGWSDKNGIPTAMSQFISVKKEALNWHIHVPSPDRHLQLKHFIHQNTVIAGFTSEEKNPGFCMVNRGGLG